MKLENTTCVPCQGGIPPLSTEQSLNYLSEIPNWTLLDQGKRIGLELKFTNFRGAFDLVKEIATLADQQGHHPDITFGWGYVRIVLYTHKIDGLHRNDFIMAAKINALIHP